MVSLCLAAAVALVGNGSFEDVDSSGRVIGWSVPKHFRFEKGCGMNGTVGLAYDNASDASFYKYPSAAVPFENGKRYEYSVRVRTENLDGAAMLCMEWYDKDRKWLSGSYQNGFRGTHDWAQLKGVTPPIPKEAVSLRVAFGVTRNSLGKAWFDDLSVTLLERPVLGGLYSDTYRNIAADGAVRFHAAANLKDHPDAKVCFTYEDASEKRVCREVKPLGDGADIVVPVTGLKMGEQDVACEAIQSDGTLLGRETMRFTRVERLPERKTWIDRKGRTIVDGKPFFPLGIYLGGVSDRELDPNFLSGPFNCVMPYQCTRAGLDRCQEFGIKVIYPLNDRWPWVEKWRAKGIETDEDAERCVEAEIAKVKDHPALLAWYVNDEIPIEKFPQLLKRQQTIEKADPGHPTWAVLYQFGEVRSYYPTFDVIGTDPYPVPKSTIGNVSMWTRTTRDEVMGLKPMWQVPQAFGWGDWSGDPKRGRMPTREEMVNMFWQCVANGANGIVCWCFRLNYRKDGFDYGRWADTCAAAASLKPYTPIFLSEEDAPAIESGITESLSVRSWRHKRHTYVAVVNNTREPLEGKVRLKGNPITSASVLEGNAKVSVEAGAIAVSLPPIGFGMIRLD